MLFILSGVYLILFLFQIAMLIFEIKKKNRFLWIIYFSSIIAGLTAWIWIPSYYGNYIGGTFTDAMNLVFLSFLVAIVCLVLIILGIIFNIKQKKIIKKENREIHKTRYAFLKSTLSFICIWGIILMCASIPRIFESDIEKYAKQYTLNYLNSKYGDGNFKVTSIVKDYHSESFGSDEWVGFVAVVKSKYIPRKMQVTLKGITESSLEVSYDGLITEYYNQDDYYDFHKYLTTQKQIRVEKNFASKFNLNMRIECYSYEIPESYGHIPSIEELIELTKVRTDYIDVTIKDELGEKELLNYLKKLSQFSIEYFDTNKDIKIYYNYGIEKGFIKIVNNTVTIKLNNEEMVFAKQEILEEKF